jgi:hypothetical protein
MTQQIICLILKYWLHVSALNSHIQIKFYTHLADLHNEYLPLWDLRLLCQYIKVITQPHSAQSHLSECKIIPEDGCSQPKHLANTLILNI